jgi:hypothetical protein
MSAAARDGMAAAVTERRSPVNFKQRNFRGDGQSSHDTPLPICVADHRWSHTGSLHRSTSKYYFVINDQLLGVECADCMLLIAAEEGVTTALAVTAAFNDLRYIAEFILKY